MLDGPAPVEFEPVSAREIPTPGTKPIPAGNIRLYHYTYPENVDKIRRDGLKLPGNEEIKNKTGVGYNTAKSSIWTYTELKPEEQLWAKGKPFVEFSVPKSSVDLTGQDTITLGSVVPADAFLDIHEPWHEMVRHSKDGAIDPEWLKGYIEQSAEIVGRNATRGNGIDTSEFVKQKKYLESQTVIATKYLSGT